MKVLFTGASSFTGAWFVGALASGGAEVTATLRSGVADYGDRRAERLARIAPVAKFVENCSFGSDAFFDVLDVGFDVLCHHAADVSNYRSLDFDVAAALQSNTFRIQAVLEKFAKQGGTVVILTGSVFEANEGSGERDLPAFSPYGLSKAFTSDTVRFWARQSGLDFSKFVISNPFGPLEEPRFCNYLVETWRSGKVATVRTPDYVRDNIHVDLLAKAYARYVIQRGDRRGPAHFGPMGYVETQGSFAQRFATEMSRRLPFACPVELAIQAEFPEPLVRTNRDRISAADYDWSEAEAWDAIARYYA